MTLLPELNFELFCSIFSSFFVKLKGNTKMAITYVPITETDTNEMDAMTHLEFIARAWAVKSQWQRDLDHYEELKKMFAYQ